ncbi:hypothetical protein GOL94_27080 [Sinorhizobium medicae]|nr:hypothetical protein [Sinorhizobium medicae]
MRSRREPGEADVLALQMIKRIDPIDVLREVMRLWMACRVQRQRIRIVVDGEVRRAVERNLDADRGSTTAGEAIDHKGRADMGKSHQSVGVGRNEKLPPPIASPKNVTERFCGWKNRGHPVAIAHPWSGNELGQGIRIEPYRTDPGRRAWHGCNSLKSPTTTKYQ